MSRKLSEHPGVRLWRKVDGGTFYLYWRDPKNGQRQRNDSTETSDPLESKRMALSLSRYLKDSAAPDLHPKITTLVGANLIDQQVLKARLAQMDDSFGGKFHEGQDKTTVVRILAAEFSRAFKCAPEDSMTALVQSIRTLFFKAGPISPVSDDVYRLCDLLLEVAKDRDNYKERARQLEGMLRQKGQKFVLKTEYLGLSQAVERFMQAPDGTKSKGAWRDKIELRLNRMAKEIGAKKNVHDLTPDETMDYLSKLEGVATTKESITTYVCKFLKWATNGQFDSEGVRKAIIDNLEYENAEWFWLTRDEALLLIKQIREDNGDYWADAATIQYGCGFRPEELPLLRRDSVQFKDKASIRIAAIYDGKGRTVRRIKTERSEDVIQVPTWAVDALKRRIEANEYLLFPLVELSWVAPRFYRDDNQKEVRSEFEQGHKLWPAADNSEFTNCFRPILRAAAEKIGKALKKAKKNAEAARFDKENIDSRTFRRTCAREMILSYGFEKAAAVLRDSIETLRKHYADLQAADVSTER